MRAVEILKEEHQAIELMLRVLGKIAQKLEKGEKVNPQHLQRILEFIKVFVNRCHHAKEEDLLFPAMEAAGIPKEDGPIGVMLGDHDAGRSYAKGMNQNLGNPAKFAENARGYIVVLKDHIPKENDILYPMAEMHLSEKTQKELPREFEIIENERIGPGKHEEFHRLLKNLQEIYL